MYLIELSLTMVLCVSASKIYVENILFTRSANPVGLIWGSEVCVMLTSLPGDCPAL